MTKLVENGIYKAKIKTKENGLNILSMVETPAIEINYIKMEEEINHIKMEVLDEEKNIVIAPALVPDMLIPRVHKGIKYYISFDKETIEQSLIKMSAEQKDQNVDINHSEKLINGAIVMEKFITNENRVTSVKGFENLPMGTLFFTAKVIDEKLMSDIKAGKINGWSIDGFYDLEIEEDVELTEDEIKILNDSVTN
jgi:hypothetical protein